MRRRDFVTLLSGAAVAWPIAAQAQQPERTRRIGLLAPYNDDRDTRVQAYLPAFKQRLHKLGWIEGRNIRFDYRFTGQDAERIRVGAEELIALAPDIIVVWANPAAAILRRATQTIPIVFTTVSDPVGGGFVANLAHPGGNITGFQNFETAIGGKWLEVLKEIAPKVRRVAFVYSPEISAHVAFMHAAEAASSSLGMTVTAAGVRNAADIEFALTAFAKEPNGGLIVAPSSAHCNRPRSDHCVGCPTASARDLSVSLFLYEWRLGVLRFRPSRATARRRVIRRSHPEGRKAGRLARAGAYQVQSGNQPQDCKGARPRRVLATPAACRRGDRVSG